MEHFTPPDSKEDWLPTLKHKTPSDSGPKILEAVLSQPEVTDELVLGLAKKDLINLIKIQVHKQALQKVLLNRFAIIDILSLAKNNRDLHPLTLWIFLFSTKVELYSHHWRSAPPQPTAPLF